MFEVMDIVGTEVSRAAKDGKVAEGRLVDSGGKTQGMELMAAGDRPKVCGWVGRCCPLGIKQAVVRRKQSR